jgi:ribonuclease HI
VATRILISPQSVGERPKLVFGRRLSGDQTYRIFTDGSAIGNPGPGGWGVVVIQGKERRELSGAHPWTTISEMELVAAIQGLRSVEGRARIELHSDSEYLIYGMRAFVFHWQRHGWRNRRGTQLQHREVWAELIELNTSLPIRWTWIKGHNGHRDQTRADELAYQAARSLWVQQKLAA